MKKNIWIRVLADMISIPLAIVGGYILKFKLSWLAQHVFAYHWGTVNQKAQIEPYLSVMWMILLIWLMNLWISGLYRSFEGLMSEVEELTALLKGVSLATLEVMALTFVYKPFPESRYVIVYAWLLGFVFISLNRLLIHLFEKRQRTKERNHSLCAIVGLDPLAQDLSESILQIPTLGYQYHGNFYDTDPEYLQYHLQHKLVRLGRLEEVSEFLKTAPIRTLFVTTPTHPQLHEWIDLCKARGITCMVMPPKQSIIPRISTMTYVAGQSFSCIAPYSLPSGYSFKIIFDKLLSFTLLIVGIPVWILIGILIKCVSPRGPILYTQERVGFQNKPFMMLKFRTMIPDAEKQTGPVMVQTQNESRYIPFGAFMRKTSLDELPQLWNIFKGEMSFVGPRPERPFFIEQFKKTIPDFGDRHVMRPGLTGWAQVNGRSYLTHRPEHKLRYDLYYVTHWDLLFDVKILIKTLLVVFKREEAY